jgi:hypothetical protein
MSLGPELDDLARRLIDLADSAGPWDDPLPEIRRRAAVMTTDSTSSVSTAFRSPTPARRPRGWLHSVDLAMLAAIAAVVTLVAGLGWVISAGQGGGSDKASSGGAMLASTAAGSAGTAAQTRAGQGRAVPSPASAAGCAWPAPTSAVTLRADARVQSGASVVVGVRLTGRAAADVYSPLVVAVQNGRVVGRLVPTFIPPGPSLRPSSPTSTSATLTGTLRRSTCAQAIAGAHRPQVPRGLALPPGRYQLIAVASGVTTSATTVVSAPVTVTVVR